MSYNEMFCLKGHLKTHCSVYQGNLNVQCYGRWLGEEQGKCAYTLRDDKYCHYYPHAPHVPHTNPKLPTTHFNFQHPYFKLQNRKFTTIRGKTHFPKIDIGTNAKLTLDEEFFCYATQTNKELKKIKEMPLALLKKDAEYPGFVIKTHHDFIKLINSFYPSNYHQATLDSEKTIIYLEKW